MTVVLHVLKSSDLEENLHFCRGPVIYNLVVHGLECRSCMQGVFLSYSSEVISGTSRACGVSG